MQRKEEEGKESFYKTLSMSNSLYHLQKALTKQRLSGFFVSNPYNIQYFTGFKHTVLEERESFLLVGRNRAWLIIPRLYAHEAKAPAGRFRRIIAQERHTFFETVMALMRSQRMRRIGFEEDNLSFAEYRHLGRGVPRCVLVPAASLLKELRLIKTEKEIRLIRKAQQLTKRAYRALLNTIAVGQTEYEIALRFRKILRDLGGDAVSFEPIVAVGQSSALPHYETGRKRLRDGEILLIDIGVRYQGYCGDSSFTCWWGRGKNSRFDALYRIVEEAQRRAITKIQPGMTCEEAFNLANDVFARRGLAKYFLHGLGHGIGLQIHEQPYLRDGSKVMLREGMVFSIEPGLYFPGWGGIRLEELVVLRKHGCEVL